MAAALCARGLERGDRVAVQAPDGGLVHAAFLGCQRAGIVVVGIGPRAGERETHHLLNKTGASVLLCGDDIEALVSGPAPADRDIPVDELFLLNSTSGTTGLPKCVMHTQVRWMYFHELAVEAGELTGEDVFLSAIPAPFGFGLWTAHFTPTLLGCPVVVMPRFSPELVIELIERERVTVLACVSTQFLMMLNSPALAEHDLSSLRCMFTGGEAVPYERAAEFEERTGAAVLQFYGSNETGALSRTTLRDTRERRLRTAGRVIEGMHVRLYDAGGRDVTATGRGQAACRGPAMSLGYLDDDDANAQLFTADGWMLTGDVCEIDGDGYLRVVGRTADFIIRGGKNISAPQVEEEVGSHPAVAMAAAVAMPDEVFGERVCVYVELRPGRALTLEDLCAHLAARGVGKELWPERLVVVGALPRSSGGKVAKGALRADIRARLAGGDAGDDVPSEPVMEPEPSPPGATARSQAHEAPAVDDQGLPGHVP